MRCTRAHQRGPDSNFFKKINIKLFPTFYIVDIVATTFQCLPPQFLSAESSTDDIIYQSAASLVATYCNDLSDSFTTQLFSFRALLKDDIKQIPTVMELAHFLVVKN